MSSKINYDLLTPEQRAVVEIAGDLSQQLRDLALELTPDDYRSKAYIARLRMAFHDTADRIDRFTRERVVRTDHDEEASGRR